MGFFNKIFNKTKTNKVGSKKLSISNTNTIYVNDSFSYFGNGKCGRPLEELDKINVQEADEVFKKCKKEMLDVFMKDYGFIKYKTNAYIRLNSIGLLEYIDLQKESHGSQTFTLNVCVLPIYVPHDVFTIGFGNRIGILINEKDFWWDYKDLYTSEKSFENIIQALELFVFPWFEQYNNEGKYQKDLFDEVGTIGNSRIKWITYLYIKHNEIDAAKIYLDDYLKSKKYLEKSQVRQEHISETIEKLKEVINSSNTNVEIINRAILYNVEKYKLPKKFSTQKYDFFWTTMELCDWIKEGDDDSVLKPVIQYLSKQDDSIIFEFDNLMTELLYYLDTKELAEQCRKVEPLMSDDSFLYSRCVALINGANYYEKAKQGKVSNIWNMEFESLLYVPSKAWALKHQSSVDAYPHIAPLSYETGSNVDGWDK